MKGIGMRALIFETACMILEDILKSGQAAQKTTIEHNSTLLAHQCGERGGVG